MNRIFVFCLLFSGSIIAQAQQPGTAGTLNYRNYEDVPAYKLLGLDSAKFSTGSLQQKGKVLIVVYFSPTCNHCISFTESVTSNLKSFKNAQFLYVSAYPLDEIRKFYDASGFRKMPDFRVGQDPDFNMGRFYDVTELPSVFVYNTKGKLKTSFDSKLKVEDLIAAVKE